MPFREDIPIKSLVNDGDNEGFLLLQTKKQKESLLRYDNDLTCMDAKHKTVKYGFPFCCSYINLVLVMSLELL